MKKKEEGIQSSFVWAEPNRHRLILGQVIYEIATWSFARHQHSILSSHRRCRWLLWKRLLDRRWEHGIGIRIGVWFLFCCCFLSLLLKEDESVGLVFDSCFVIAFWISWEKMRVCLFSRFVERRWELGFGEKIRACVFWVLFGELKS